MPTCPRLSLALALVVSSACASSSNPAPTPSPATPAPVATPAPSPAATSSASSELALAPGQTRAVTGLEITFESVAEDSRCPAGVQCIWEGDAKVLLAVHAPGATPTRVELHTSHRFAREAEHAGLRLTLVSVTPAPAKDRPVAAKDYRVTVSVSSAAR